MVRQTGKSALAAYFVDPGSPTAGMGQGPTKSPIVCLASDIVEKVEFEVIVVPAACGRQGSDDGRLSQVASLGAGTGINLASFRRFWAVAARWNSSRAPFGPRNRNRSSFRMRLRWANSISIFFRSRLEVT